MGRKRKTRWRRLSIGEISANEDEDGELGGAVISLTRSHSHSASQNHSPARHLSDKSLSAVITMTNNNKDSSSTASLHNSSTNLSAPPGSGGGNGGGHAMSSSGSSKLLSSSSAPPAHPDKSQIPPQNPSSSSSSPNPHSQSDSGYHNGHHHGGPSFNNSTHPPPNSVSSNESGCGSTSSSTGGGGGGHYNDRYHYTRENYRPPHHHHSHHHNNHHSSYNGASSHYQGGGEGGSSSRGERGSSYHYSGHPHGHKEYQNGYHGPGHYSGYQGSTYYRNSHNNYRNSHYSGGGNGASGSGGEPYNGGESEGYHYPPSSRPYGGRFRKSRTYPSSSYYYANGSSKSSGGASNNTTDNINRPSYNQDEYTKITTPRQDVLFKKGYLSQKKTQPSSSSVDSASAATTPSASTNGTPDTQSTNGINSDNSEGYENGETDYVIPYDDTIYYAAPPPPEAVFTDPNTGQVYYGHCSSTGEYYDAYPVSPVMVAAGYPPVYYPMVPYAPIDWNSVPAPMYPMVAAPPAPQLPSAEDSLLSPGLQGLESSPATTTNPNTNSDTTSSSATAGGAVDTTTSSSTPASSTVPTPGAEGSNPEVIISSKEVIRVDSGVDSGSNAGDEASPATSQGSSIGAEEEGPRITGIDDPICPGPACIKNAVQKSSSEDAVQAGVLLPCCSSDDGKGDEEDNNNEGANKTYEIVKGVEKLHLSKDKEEYSSSESVLSSASSTTSGKVSPPATTCTQMTSPSQENPVPKTMEIDTSTLPLSVPNAIANSNPAAVKSISAMVISSHHHHPHLTTGLSYPVATTSGLHPQAIPVGSAPVMTTVPVPVGCPPVMIAAAPNGMPLPPLVPATPMHHMGHPPPPSQGGPGHHHHHPHNNHHHAPHHSHHSHHPHHMHHHPPPHHPHHQHHGPPQHHSTYPHHNHPRHHGPPHPPHHPQHPQNSPHHHHHHHHQHHHMPPPLPPPSAQSQPTTQTAPPPLPPVALGTAPNVGPPPPPGSTPYHVYPHPTAYVYGPPVYNDEGSTSETSTGTTVSSRTTIIAATPTGIKDLTEGVTLEERRTSDVESTRQDVEDEGNNRPIEKSNEMGKEGESCYDESLVVKTEKGTTRKAERARVTGSEAATTKQSFDSKLENIIASEDFVPDTTTPISTPATCESKGVPSSIASPLVPYSIQSEEIIMGAASLTLESPDKMNKEIEIRPLKQETSGTGAAEKVAAVTPQTPSPTPAPDAVEVVAAQAQVTNSGSSEESNVKEDVSGKVAVLTSFPSSSSSSTESSCPSSTNESSTSSPVNEGASLMRSQSKLASRKNFVDDDNSKRESPEVGMPRGKGSGKKKKQNSHSASALSSNNGNNKNKTNSEMNESVNLSGNDRNCKRQRQQMGNGDEKEENNKNSSNSNDTSQEGNGQESQNQMTVSVESGQQVQESSYSSSSSSSFPSPQEAEGVLTSLLNSSQLTTKQTAGAETTAGTSSSSASTSSSASKKPADLIVQCPPTNGTDEGHYEALQLQRSPSLVNEPSSPDSLNTNQSVAGSEIAPGENLSVSESDLMNRTTSIDEVEEDLPQEVEYVVGSEQGVQAPSTTNSFTSVGNNEATSKSSTEVLNIISNSPSAAAPAEPKASTDNEAEVATTTPTEQEQLNEGLNTEGEGEEVNCEVSSCLEISDGVKGEADVEEPIKNGRAMSPISSTPPQPSTSSRDSTVKSEVEEAAGEVPLRPQSITLAVTEWLKTQGEDALTPIIPRASSSDEFEGDVEETTDSEDEDYNEDDDDDGRIKGRKRDDKASNLEQNQKNVYGNPWVAPSNKSGSSICKVTSSRRRSGSKKSAMKENEGSRTGLPKSDGVCSRVAPLLSSKSSSSTSASLESNNSSSNNISYNTSAHISTCSTIKSMSDDQDENYLTDNSKKDKHSIVSTSTSLISHSEAEKTSNTAERDVGKDYDSGLELSSPENSSSSSSVVVSTRNISGLTATTTNNNTNANNKSTELDDAAAAAVQTTPAESSFGSIREHKCERPTLSRLITNNRHNKCITPNPDQIVIAAPLSIIQPDDSATCIDAPGKSDESTKSEYEPEKYDEPSSSSSASSRNNTTPTSPSAGNTQSPGSLQSSSIDERDHAEICDPQKYAKYYQFGVVFDTSDDPDQGIDTAAEEEEEEETDSLEDITLNSPSTSPTDGAQQHEHQTRHHQKNTDDFLQIMMQRNRKLAKKARKSEGERQSGDRVLVSKSVYLQDEDEEIGTFDPKVVLESRLRRGSAGTATGPNSISPVVGEDALDYVIRENDLVAAASTSNNNTSPAASHLYVNPMSLAAEMSGSEIVKLGMHTKSNPEGADDNSSFDSSEEPPLPPYESPPSVEIPVYNTTTPAGRVIRQNFYAIGDPVSGAICCSIQ